MRRNRRVIRLRNVARLLLSAYESRLSGRLFAACLIAGTVLSLATWTPPYLVLACLIAWPLVSAVICGLYLAISAIELRCWRVLGLGAGLALHLLFLGSVSGALLLLMYPEWALALPS